LRWGFVAQYMFSVTIETRFFRSFDQVIDECWLVSFAPRVFSQRKTWFLVATLNKYVAH